MGPWILFKLNIVLHTTTIVKGVNNVVQFMAFFKMPPVIIILFEKKDESIRNFMVNFIEEQKRSFNAFFTSFIVMNSFMTLIYLSMLKKMS